jgi:dienelactone hydrolase
MLVVCVTPCSVAWARAYPIETHAARDQCNDIRHYLNRVAEEVTQDSLAEIQTLDQWRQARPARQAQYLEMMGLVDVPLTGPRPPLNVKVVGTLQQSGYRIEKLRYESLGQLYVPANLYIPDGITTPVPAILYVCGHARTQKVRYQAHARRFAELGFVCLIIETIQWGEVRGDHWGCYARGWFHWYSRGYTPAGVELWNALRGLDLLCARPEVDAGRLGVTGISGGGTQTWYIAAADPRIKAAATVCGTTTIQSHVFQRTIDGHCDCMMPINTYRWDFHDLGALIAPRPLLIASANRDGLNAIEAVRDVYHRTQAIYELYDSADHLSLVETPGGHSYHPISRKRIFSFFLKHLMGQAVPAADIEDIDESEAAMLTEAQLQVYPEGPPADDRTTTIQDSFIVPASPPDLADLPDEPALARHRAEVSDFLRVKTFGAFPADPVPLDIRQEFRARDGAPWGRTTYSFVTERGFRLKVELRWRHPPEEAQPLMLVLRNPDEDRWASEGFMSGLADTWNIATLECRGIGETGWSANLQWHIRRAAAWTGRTVASMRVYDVLRCLEVVRSLRGVAGDHVALAARGEMAAVAAYAGFLDPQVWGVVLKDPPATQNAPSEPDGRGPALEMLNCLRVTDLPQITGLLFPRPVAVLGTVPESYHWARDLYRSLGSGDRFQQPGRLADWNP